MRAATMFGCLAPACLVQPAHAHPKLATIPTVFRGEWDETLSDCATRSGEGHVTITARRIGFYASDGDVIDSSAITARSVTLGVAYTSEGAVVHRVDKLALSPSGDVLTITSDNGVFTKHRCPVEKKN